MKEYKEIPLLFSAPMVAGTLADLKTQTRRIRGLDKINNDPDSWIFKAFGPNPNKSNDAGNHAYFKLKDSCDTWMAVKCPYGQAGDRIWVRETWCDPTPDKSGWPILYFADMPVTYYGTEDDPEEVVMLHAHHYKWKPSIHMPRDYSRIMLEIVSIRMERLNDISEEDAKAEGINWNEPRSASCPPMGRTHFPGHAYLVMDKSQGTMIQGSTAVIVFTQLWEEINGEGSWNKNPWVWVVEFKRHAQSIGIDFGSGPDYKAETTASIDPDGNIIIHSVKTNKS